MPSGLFGVIIGFCEHIFSVTLSYHQPDPLPSGYWSAWGALLGLSRASTQTDDSGDQLNTSDSGPQWL